MEAKSTPELLLETQAAIEEAQAAETAAQKGIDHAKEVARAVQERFERALDEGSVEQS